MEEGWVCIDRTSTETWQWQKPEWWKAWTWMLVNAAHRDCPEKGLLKGQLYISTRLAEKEWGVSRYAAHDFLTRCAEAGAIIWEKNRPHGRPKSKNGQTDTQTVFGLVTICDYARYFDFRQSTRTVFQTVLSPEPKGFSEAVETPSAPAKKRKPATPKPPPDPRIKRLIDYYHDRHVEVIGYKPQIFGVVDGQLMKKIINTCQTEEEVMARIDRFLEDDMSWMTDPSWEISRLYKRLNKYATRGNSAQAGSIWGDK